MSLSFGQNGFARLVTPILRAVGERESAVPARVLERAQLVDDGLHLGEGFPYIDLFVLLSRTVGRARSRLARGRLGVAVCRISLMLRRTPPAVALAEAGRAALGPQALAPL